MSFGVRELVRLATRLKSKPNPLNARLLKRLLMKYARTDDSIRFLSEKEGSADASLPEEYGVHALLQEWVLEAPGSGATLYAESVEEALARQITSLDGRLRSRRSRNDSKAVPFWSSLATAGYEAGFTCGDLHGSFQLPFDVEVWGVDPNGKNYKVPVDVYLEVGPPADRGADADDGADAIHVTAQPRLAEAWEVPAADTLYAALTLGGLGINEEGKISPRPLNGGGFKLASSAVSANLANAAAADADGGTPTRSRHKSSVGSSTRGGRAVSFDDDVGRQANYSESRVAARSVDDISQCMPGSLRPSDEGIVWTKITPEMREFTDSTPESELSVCPPDSRATFSFEFLGDEGADDMPNQIPIKMMQQTRQEPRSAKERRGRRYQKSTACPYGDRQVRVNGIANGRRF